MEFTVRENENPTSDEQRADILKDPKFGKEFTDHMVAIDWTEDEGWHNARVQPYAPLEFEPAAMVCLLYTF